MAFNDFIQTELPLRPFVLTDGAPGQSLVRSNNPLAPRELTWVDTQQNQGFQLTMGETLTAGTPLYISNGALFAADNLTNTTVIGLLESNTSVGLMGTVVTFGKIAIVTTPGLPYFLGNKIITSTPPTSGMVVKLGQSLTPSVFLVNIAPSILLMV